ncbi:p53-like protein 2 [Lissonota sp. PSUC_FEM 10030012]|nr:p53-like protein 2 [Lissonota sp. PSUC_FEM 10030012]
MTSDTSNASAYGDKGSQFASNVEEIVPKRNENNEAVSPFTLKGDEAIKRYEIDLGEGTRLLKVFEYPKLRSGEEYDVMSTIVIKEANNKMIRVAAIVINREAFPNKRDITKLNVLSELPDHYDALNRQLNESEPMASHVFKVTLRRAKDIVLVGVDQPLQREDSNAMYKIVVHRSKFTLQRKQRVHESKNLMEERATRRSEHDANGSGARRRRSLSPPPDVTNESAGVSVDSNDEHPQSMLFPLLGVGSACALIGFSYLLMNKGRTETDGRRGKYTRTKNLQ